MDIAGYRLSSHALERMVEMGLTAQDVEDCLRNYTNRYSQSRYGPDRVMYQDARIGVGTAEPAGEVPVIVTVLWNRKEQWDR
jgi:hypothetical protein